MAMDVCGQVIRNYSDMPLAVRISALDTLHVMTEELDIGDQKSSILHALCRVITFDSDLRAQVRVPCTTMYHHAPPCTTM